MNVRFIAMTFGAILSDKVVRTEKPPERGRFPSRNRDERESARHVFWFAVVVLLIGLAERCRAQGPTIAPIANGETKAEHFGFKLLRDRQVDQWVELARNHLAKSQFGEAITHLERLVRVDRDLFVESQGQWITPRAEAVRLSQQLPAESQRLLFDELDRIDSPAWDRAKATGALADMTDFAGRFPEGACGLEAMTRVAAHLRDTGHPDRAALAWQAVAAHPRATKEQAWGARCLVIESWQQANRPDQVLRVLNEPWARPHPATMRLEGNDIDPAEWLRTQRTDAVKALASRSTASSETVSQEATVSGLASSRESLPAWPAAWTIELALPSSLKNPFLQQRRYFREQAIPSLLAHRPKVVGDLILVRLMEHLIALNAANGDTRWKLPNDEFKWLADNPRYLENSSFMAAMTADWHRRTEVDSLFGTIASDGRDLWIIQGSGKERHQWPLNGGAGPVRPPNLTTWLWNRVAAVDVQTGGLRWQVGGPATGPADPLGGTTFLGLPLPLDDQLFCLGQQDGELKLIVLTRETGHLVWSKSLGVPSTERNEAPDRRSVACPLVLSRGHLICSTNCGALVAVDPVTRRVAWVHHYPVTEPFNPVQRFGNGARTVKPIDAWWNGWRETKLIDVSSFRTQPARPQPERRIVVAAEDSPELRAFDPESGQETWSVPRRGGLYLAGVSPLCRPEGIAVVCETSSVRGQDLRDGTTAWQADVGAISGCGTIHGDVFVQPLRAGGVAILDLNSGLPLNRPLSTLAGARPVVGQLMPCPGGWVCLSDDGVVRCGTRAGIRQESLARVGAEPSDTEALETLAELELDEGHAQAARERLRHLTTPRSAELRREALMALIRNQATAYKAMNSKMGSRGKQPDGTNSVEEPSGTSTVPQRQLEQARLEREALGRELLEVATSPDDRLVVHRVLGEAAADMGDLTAAVDHFLDGLELLDVSGKKSVGNWFSQGSGGRTIRRDRVLAAGIDQVFQLATAMNGKTTLLPQIEKRLSDRLDRAEQSADPFAAKRLVEGIQPLAWGRQRLMSQMAEGTLNRRAETTCLSLIGSRSPDAAFQAGDLLASAWSRSGWRDEADGIARRLLRQHPGRELSTPLDEARRTRLLSPPADPWPTLVLKGDPATDKGKTEGESGKGSGVVPKISLGSFGESEAEYSIPVMIHSQTEGLFDQFDLHVQRLANSVYLSGGGFRGVWKIALTGPAPARRSLALNANELEAWTAGRLIILKIGVELFGLSPLDERGEPHGRCVWHVDMSGQTDRAASSRGVPPVEVIAARPGLRHGGVRLLDEFGYPIGQVGPVRPDYVCHVSRKSLITLDSQTGQIIWEHPLDTVKSHVFGDEDHVWLWRPLERIVQTLSAIDGRVLGERTWAADPNDVIHAHGGLVWLAVPKPTPNLELHDLRTGKLIWNRSFGEKAVPFVLDEETFGVVEPSGSLHLVSARTGDFVNEPLAIDVPSVVDRVVVHRDDRQWYVALSEPVAAHARLQAEQLWGGQRLSFMTGPWVAIRRDQKTVTWKRTLTNEPVCLDASRVSPVFVQAWRVSKTENGRTVPDTGIFRVIDKRTGETLVERSAPHLPAYYILHPSANRDRLTIQTAKERIELRDKAESSNN